MEEVPDWLLFDQQDVHDTLVATSKHKPHLIADMAAMANVPGLANGQARRPVVLQTQQYASQVRSTFGLLLCFSVRVLVCEETRRGSWNNILARERS